MQPNAKFSNQATGNETFFNGLTMAPVDAIFGVKAAFIADQSPQKVNLGVGVYRDDQGRTTVLKSVKKAEEIILLDESLGKDYLPIIGDGVSFKNLKHNKKCINQFSNLFGFYLKKLWIFSSKHANIIPRNSSKPHKNWC